MKFFKLLIFLLFSFNNSAYCEEQTNNQTYCNDQISTTQTPQKIIHIKQKPKFIPKIITANDINSFSIILEVKRKEQNFNEENWAKIFQAMTKYAEICKDFTLNDQQIVESLPEVVTIIASSAKDDETIYIAMKLFAGVSDKQLLQQTNEDDEIVIIREE